MPENSRYVKLERKPEPVKAITHEDTVKWVLTGKCPRCNSSIRYCRCD